MKEFERLTDIVKILRSENGCPWDKEQNLYSMKAAIMEEASELVDALDNKDIENIKEELGDVLLHVVMHSQMASEDKLFDIEEVAKGINEKLIRRHPHVFGNENINNSGAVIKRWEEVKREEKKDKPTESILDNVPNNMPSLLKAQKIQHKAGKVGFDWKNTDDLFDKLDEEVSELKSAYKSGVKEDVSEELGDVLFVLVNIARHNKLDADESLRKTINKFRRRFLYVEKRMKESEKELSADHFKEMDKYWNEARINDKK